MFLEEKRKVTINDDDNTFIPKVYETQQEELSDLLYIEPENLFIDTDSYPLPTTPISFPSPSKSSISEFQKYYHFIKDNDNF